MKEVKSSKSSSSSQDSRPVAGTFPGQGRHNEPSAADEEESSLFSRSSWNPNNDNDDDEQEFIEQASSSRTGNRSRGLSFSEHQQQIELEYESIHGCSPPRSSSSTQPPHNNNNNNNNTNVPTTEQERQLLLLMLLAQVCALHDPTPRTFTVHVLELFERGILDRSSIHFLFELGLVPSLNVATKLLPPSSSSTPHATNRATTTTTTTTTTAATQGSATYQERQIVTASSNTTTTTTTIRNPRSVEVSAIRSTLERQESAAAAAGGGAGGAEFVGDSPTTTSPPSAKAKTSSHNNNNTNSTDNNSNMISWSAEHHPLSLSRYQREFTQVGMLSSGSFGQVYQATNKMDGRDYAIKRVPFSASGYSTQSVQQVTREVQCLAACNHPHVVRYYTSWLEPSWMTGSGGKAATVFPTSSSSGIRGVGGLGGGGAGGAAKSTHKTSPLQKQKLLTAAAEHDESKKSSSSSSSSSSTGGVTGEPSVMTAEDVVLDYFKELPPPRLPRRRFSFDNSDSWLRSKSGAGDDEDECWSSSESDGDDESDIFDRSKTSNVESSSRLGGGGTNALDDWFTRKPKKKKAKQPVYRYQICLFIQMQLCHPSTLADWIRERNRQTMENSSLAERLRPAMRILEQIGAGLGHVHNKGIVHRDLKPANIFASQDGSSFLIGDFGLSKLLLWQQDKTRPNNGRKRHEERLLLMDTARDFYEPANNAYNNEEPSWRDPLTKGIGTASYASPEQVASRSYGKEADIFSVGLILLELLCCFGTEHERIQTFHDCRYRRDLPKDIRDIPALARIILQCTDPCPENRPSAERLRQFAVFSMSAESNMKNILLGGVDTNDQHEEQTETEVERLKRQLAEKEKQVDQLQSLLEQKDQTIGNLQEQVSSLRMAAIQTRTIPFPPSLSPSPRGENGLHSSGGGCQSRSKDNGGEVICSSSGSSSSEDEI